jgi:hypothetical protein
MLHHDVFSLLFSEIHTWIKRALNTYGRYGWPKKLIGDHFHIFPMFSTKPPRHFWCKERKSPNPTCLGCWIWIAGHNQVVTAATTSYELPLERYSTSWKAYQVYFFKNGSRLLSISFSELAQSSFSFADIFYPGLRHLILT